ncbi:chorismate mutase [Aquibacillus koreensis]|uniref:chorismate mutase n=1 Tax=Aquibacillus koreensis TaxID=279446 RepID=A0A9X3WGZ6_9BACI|nr:chorismate mutase [Aquibacillus koreensis]MCT2537382.1 chorismate mutase [Aquibacillus koreensis]MDC3418828.1 chorismate mutase [Aquibacillus koreensis]
MIRGVRGATTVESNEADEIVANTKILIEEMANANDIQAEDIASVMISVTSDLNATFPAKALRLIEGWKYVPVMCMKEIEVPGSLALCIRIMMTVNTSISQVNIQHVYHHKATQLRPDLTDQ